MVGATDAELKTGAGLNGTAVSFAGALVLP